MTKIKNPKQLKHSDVSWLRDKLLEEQNSICPICKREIENPVLDHEHTRRIKGSGLVRGVLCRSCNVLLGKMENNCIRYGVPLEELPSVLVNMSKYIKKKHKPYIHPSEMQKPPKLMKSSYNELVKEMKQQDKQKIPEYPKSGRLTVQLSKLFEKYEIKPRFYP